MLLRGGADLRLSGPAARLALSGRVVLTEGRYEGRLSAPDGMSGLLAKTAGHARRLGLFALRARPWRDMTLEVDVTAAARPTSTPPPSGWSRPAVATGTPSPASAASSRPRAGPRSSSASTRVRASPSTGSRSRATRWWQRDVILDARRPGAGRPHARHRPRQDRLGPRDASGKPAGGLGTNVLSVELRRHLVENFTGSLFADLGNIVPNRTRGEDSEGAYRSRNQLISDTLGDFFRGFRPALGFGLQHQTPVGPARQDIAFNPDRDDQRDEDACVVHFSLGMAF